MLAAWPVGTAQQTQKNLATGLRPGTAAAATEDAPYLVAGSQAG